MKPEEKALLDSALAAIKSTPKVNIGIQPDVWKPSTERPSGYPEDLPFVPGVTACAAVTEREPGFAMVQWWCLSDLQVTLQELVDASLGEEWETVPEGEQPSEQMVFVRG